MKMTLASGLCVVDVYTVDVRVDWDVDPDLPGIWYYVCGTYRDRHGFRSEALKAFTELDAAMAWTEEVRRQIAAGKEVWEEVPFT